jgi:hypothetical protein
MGTTCGVPALRSDLVQRVLKCLCDHPHDDTVERVTARLGLASADAVEAALVVLAEDGLVLHVNQHWSLTRPGWAQARAVDPAA